MPAQSDSSASNVIERLEKESKILCECEKIKKENTKLKILLERAVGVKNKGALVVEGELKATVGLSKENEKRMTSFGIQTKMEPVTVPHFCPPEFSNHTKWEKETRPKINYLWGGQAMFQDRYLASNNSHWFCDKVQYNLDPWVEPKLSPDDFVIGIYTGERIFYSRSSVVVDTWLHRFKHHYLYAALGEPSIPVQGLERYSLKPEYSDNFATSYFQIRGLKDIYLKNPSAKWYYIVGCDTFLNSDYMMRALESFDPSKDW